MSKRGVSVFEIVALIFIVIAAYFGDVVGSRYGNVMGILGMIVFPIVLVIAIEGLAWIERELFIGQKPLPMCECGKFSIDQMTTTEVETHQISTCACGRQYETGLRGRVLKKEDGVDMEYALWRPFKGWQVNEKELCRRS